MTQAMTRKAFCESLLCGSVVLLIQGCGGGDNMSGQGSGNPPPLNTCTDTISGNHGHVLSVDVADLDSMVDKVYNMQGSATHNHTLTLTVAQLRMLEAGTAVTATSTTTDFHSHVVTVTCA